jgi:hypothetical protein
MSDEVERLGRLDELREQVARTLSLPADNDRVSKASSFRRD